MDFDQIIFKEKTFSSLIEDIYKNSKSKDKEIKEIIQRFKDMINSPSEAVMLMPILKDAIDSGIKNDDALIKLASIIQKAMTNTSSESGDYLTEEEKQALMSEIKTLKLT